MSRNCGDGGAGLASVCAGCDACEGRGGAADFAHRANEEAMAIARRARTFGSAQLLIMQCNVCEGQDEYDQ
eukprot:8227490-Pyramimonas_sp.AAC.1